MLAVSIQEGSPHYYAHSKVTLFLSRAQTCKKLCSISVLSSNKINNKNVIVDDSELKIHVYQLFIF